jgi:hypothetical protein
MEPDEVRRRLERRCGEGGGRQVVSRREPGSASLGREADQAFAS